MTPNQLPLADFVGQFHSPDLRARITALAETHDLIAARDPTSGRLSVAAVESANRAPLPANTISVYARATRKPEEILDVKSRTQQALDLVDGGMSAYAAARAVGVDQAAISRALKARARGPRCPTCGQLIKGADAQPTNTEEQK